MIAKLSRLPKDEFRARGYKTIKNPFFSLKIKTNALGKSRMAVVAGKSIHKSAAKRNFWKRQAKAGLLLLATKNAHNQKNGIDVLIILSPGMDKLTKKRFQEELLKTSANI